MYYDQSPYNYGMGNPIRYIDPTGMSAKDSTERREIRSDGYYKDGKYYIEIWYGYNSQGSGSLGYGSKMANDTYRAVMATNAKQISSIEGVPIFKTNLIGKGGGVTLPGIGIFISSKSSNDNSLIRHEFGHVLHARKLGNLIWYPIKTLPSLISATRSSMTNSKHIHRNTSTETEANDLSYTYFNKPIVWGQPINWDIQRFPLNNAYPAPLIAPNDVYNTLFN